MGRILDNNFDPEERSVARDILIGVASGLTVFLLVRLGMRLRK